MNIPPRKSEGLFINPTPGMGGRRQNNPPSPTRPHHLGLF